MAGDSYYELLQVQPTADLEIIQAAYRRLMLRYHPDRNRSPDAEEMAIRLNLALEILSDPGKRETYDRELAARTRRTAGGTRQEGSRSSSPPPHRPPQQPPRPAGRPPMAVSRRKVFAILTTFVIAAAAVIFVVGGFKDGGTSGLKNPQPFNTRGLSYHKSGHYQLAIQDYDRAIQLNPIYADYYVNRGRSYEELGQYLRAIQDYDKAIRFDPNDAWAYYNRSVAHFKDALAHDRLDGFSDARADADRAKACSLDSYYC